MNYITQIKGFWLLLQQHNLNTTDIALYFYLLEVCNSTNWQNPFKRNNAKTMDDLKISRSSLERSRKRLNSYGILKFKSTKGSANITYQLIDLETLHRDRYKQYDATTDAGSDAGGDGLNKNSKQKPKQEEVLSCKQAFAFYVETANNRMLKDRYQLDNEAMRAYFTIFYDSKIDLGDLANKTMQDIARNFYYWLPKHLGAQHVQKEKSCAKKESNYPPPVRGVAAAMKFAEVNMREEV